MIKKTWIGAILSVWLLFTIFTIPATAEVRVPDINIDVTLCDDGSAIIRQEWDTWTDEGTEFYFPFRTNGYLEIKDFTVSDQHGVYTTLDTWNIDADFEEKARRCGLYETDEGYEFCWGISSYGNNHYTLQYTVVHLFNAYTDSDGTLFRFVNDDLDFTPTNVKLTMHRQDGKPLTDSECNIWAFGYDGDIHFEDGVIIAKTASAIQRQNHMTLMVELRKGVLHPTRSLNSTFAKIKENAFENSDYQIGDEIPVIILIGIFAVFLGILLAVVLKITITAIVRKLQLKKLSKTFGYWREAPNSGNLAASAFLGQCFSLCDESAALGAYMLRLLANGNLVSVSTEEVGAFGRISRKNKLQLQQAPTEDALLQKLYKLLDVSAGEDGILDEKELEKFCRKKPKELRSFLDQVKTTGRQYFVQKHCFKRNQRHSFKKNEPRAISHLTETGKQELGQLLGLKRFLMDFSLIDERSLEEAAVWKDYMVYAQLLGVADKVIAQLKKLYPNRLPEIEQLNRDILYTHTYYHCMYHTMRVREQQLEAAAHRAAGSGGSASFGGGGGFSGGGSGGGVR